MNGWRKVLLAAILTAAEGTGALGQAPAAPQSLALPQAVELALKNNSTVQAADAYAEAVEQGIARAGRFLRLDFSEQVATVSALLTVGFFPRTKNPRLEERQPWLPTS